MICIYYANVNSLLPDNIFDTYLKILPAALQDRNKRLHRREDRHLNLYGKLLLRKGLIDQGFDNKALLYLRYNKYCRPFINSAIDFNISHSGRFVMCAVSSTKRVGIDIEEIKPIDFENYRNAMTAGQWLNIEASDAPLQLFYKYWTTKESILKADSIGLNYPLPDLDIDSNYGICNGIQWFINELELSQFYSCHLATDKIIDKSKISIFKIEDIGSIC